MIRRLNYTGRKRILREHAQIVLRESKDTPGSFVATLQLGDYDLPSDALVFVEAYRQSSWMRFEFGSVGAITEPANRALTEFDSTEAILFRVRVTSTDSPRARLLAEADRIPLRRLEEKPGERVPLLPVQPADIGEEIARVEFDDAHGTTLLINRAVGDWRDVALSPAFYSLVYSQALREILTRILRVEGHSDSETPDNWRSQWLRFAKLLPGVTEPPEQEESDRFDDWIDQAVQAFARRHGVLARFTEFWRGEGT
jgi:hypothetical protein